MLSCSCPDWAILCKHVAATLYGVGARLDHEPKMLFTLRGVDPAEMVEAAFDRPPSGDKSRSSRMLPSDGLSSVFGVDIDMGGVSPGQTRKKKPLKKAAEAKKRITTRAVRQRKK